MTPTPAQRIPPLNDALTPEQLARSLAAVESRLERRRRVRRVAAPATLVVVLSALTWAWRAEHAPVVSPAEPGPLVGVAGRSVPETLASAEAEETLTLADRSSVRLLPRARVRVRENTGRRLWLKQEQGEVEYEVTPGGPRLWRIEVGATTVDVLGTHFWVRERDGQVGVEVTRGKVLVKNAEFAGGDVLLGAGERVEVPAAPRGEAFKEPALTPETPMRAPNAAAAPVGSAVRPASPLLQPVPPPPVPPEPERGGSFEALLVRSEEAREAGRYAESAAELRAALSRFPDDARSDIARVALANVLLDRLKAPDEAFEVLDGWLSAQTRSSLAEEGLARLVEAAVRSGRAAEARRRHAEFVAAFPGSSRLSAVNRWINTLSPQPPP